jgi:aromatic ring-cleaving dioxygenase
VRPVFVAQSLSPSLLCGSREHAKLFANQTEDQPWPTCQPDRLRCTATTYTYITIREHFRSRPACASKLASNFPVQAGRLSDDPIGPHPISQFAVIFEPDAFQAVIPWLMLNRQGLDILVHPLTDDMVDDHSVYALWLGTPIKLKLETMQRRGYSAALLPAA